MNPLGTIYATPEAMLEAVYNIGCEESRGYMEDRHCRFCNAWIDTRRDGTPYEPHAEDCLFFEIEAYLKEIGRI